MQTQIDYFKESLKYDQAAAECYALVDIIKKKRVKDEESAMANEWDAPQYYDLVINVLNEAKRKFQNEAKTYFDAHKKSETEFDFDAMNELLVGIVKSWVNDYETAICRPVKDEKEMSKLRNEAKYLVKDTIINRIDRMHKQFVKTAHDKLFEIVEDTANAPKKVYDNGTAATRKDNMRNACPLCGGAMYSKRLAENKYLIKCVGCYLSEIVFIGS